MKFVLMLIIHFNLRDAPVPISVQSAGIFDDLLACEASAKEVFKRFPSSSTCYFNGGGCTQDVTLETFCAAKSTRTAKPTAVPFSNAPSGKCYGACAPNSPPGQCMDIAVCAP